MQPRGPSATEVLVDSLKAKQDELLKHEIPARNTTVVLPGSTAPNTDSTLDSSAIADSQPSDSQLLVASMKARRAEMDRANVSTHADRGVGIVALTWNCIRTSKPKRCESWSNSSARRSFKVRCFACSFPTEVCSIAAY